MNSIELIDTKRKLYLLLLEKNNNDLSDNEINIMYELSKDKDIQKILENGIQGN